MGEISGVESCSLVLLLLPLLLTFSFFPSGGEGVTGSYRNTCLSLFRVPLCFFSDKTGDGLFNGKYGEGLRDIGEVLSASPSDCEGGEVEHSHFTTNGTFSSLSSGLIGTSSETLCCGFHPPSLSPTCPVLIDIRIDVMGNVLLLVAPVPNTSMLTLVCW